MYLSGTCRNCILARRSSVDIGPSADDDHALDSNADQDDDDIRNILDFGDASLRLIIGPIIVIIMK